MFCPFCNHPETKVIDSRLVSEGNQVRRRRECMICTERFTTFEIADLVLPRIVKRDGRISPFDEQKLRAGILRALEKRPATSEQIESLVQHILHRVRASGEREIRSQLLGEWTMDELRKLDQVAYVRFASVYRSFQDVNAFHEEIQKLRDEKTNHE